MKKLKWQLIVDLATYDEGSSYDQSAAQGFIKIHGLSQTTQATKQLLKGGASFDLPGVAYGK